MPGLQLLEIVPDKIFEQRTVSEIEQIQQSINSEIERKREELRTLVGERYRDLIEAADTIANMKLLSEQVIQDVENMNTSLADLQKKHCCENSTKSDKPSFTKSSADDEIIAQIKLLITLPEYIWSAIDTKNYVEAAQLYLLGRYIKTGFTLDKYIQQVTSNFFVLEREWTTLSHFPGTILKSAEQDLQQTDLDLQESCTCLASVALLENTSLVSKYLSLRTSAIKKVLTGDDNVKVRIIDSHNAVVSSIFTLHYCFFEPWESGNGMVWKIVNSLPESNSPSVVNLMEENIHFKYLPSIVKDFRAIALNKGSMLPADELRESIIKWLKNIRAYISNQGKILLLNISTLRSLKSLTNVNIRLGIEWAQVLKTIEIVDTISLWNELYQPLVTLRAKDLISLHWDEAFDEILEYLKNVLKEDFTKNPELDLRWFVWSESSSDLGSRNNNDPAHRGLWLKAKGISPRVANICSLIQKKLETLYGDLSEICDSEDILTTNTKELRIHQQTACLNMILRLKEFVREVVSNESTNESQLAVIARLLQAIPELCPALQKCLTLAEENKINSWHEAKTLLNAESLSCWGFWEDMTAVRLKKVVTNSLLKPKTFADLLNVIPQWDLVTIEEGEEGNVHQSQLKIPSFPSLPLVSVLHVIAAEISRVHVPRLVYDNLMQKVLKYVLECYSPETLCQAQAMQYLFDLKYLLNHFIPTTNKELFNLCHEKISQMEKQIDPFDLDVSSPHIHDNVKSSVQRLQTLLGGASHHSEAIASSVKISEDPSIIAMSKTSANVWFPPLPVTNPSNRPLQIMKTKASKVRTEPAPRGTSTSFFTDWFT